ncbi:IclR family transcriptional regulator [Afipia felis]|uniref:IclR family transcriptional regulator n=1 Tax=Afipia felis TaxID=1035 RepID=UPI001AEC30CF|nr:IclR family transcriptional regulator [Afipia felis]
MRKERKDLQRAPVEVKGRSPAASRKANAHVKEPRAPQKAKTKKSAGEDRYLITALARGLSVLSAFKPGDDTLTNLELARRTGLAKATVTRLTHTLRYLGYLSNCSETGRFRLHPHVLSLGYPVLANLGIRQMARPAMQELADYSGGTVSLGARDMLHIIFVERVRNRSVVTLPLDVGSCIPIATTSSGRAYIAAISESERAQLLSEIKAAYPQNWPRLKRGIEAACEEYNKFGYCSTIGDWEPNINAVGVPLRLPDGQVLAFTCGGPSSRIQPGMIQDLGDRLKQLAEGVQMVHLSSPASFVAGR